MLFIVSECPGILDSRLSSLFLLNVQPLTRYRALAEACPGANEKLQVEGWFGQLADLNQDPGMRDARYGTTSSNALKVLKRELQFFEESYATRLGRSR